MQDKLTIREVADYLGVSRTTVSTMVRKGELPASKNPVDKRQHLVPLAAVEQLKKQGRTNGTRRASGRRFVSDGIASNPDAIPSSRIKDWVRETWHRDRR